MAQNSGNSVRNHQSLVAQVRGMITSNWVSQAIYVAAELRIPDLLANGAMMSDEIATAVGTHAPTMKRFLRALTTIEICSEREDGSFELTEQGGLLCSDCEDSLRSWALYTVGYLWPIWGHLIDSVRTGRSAREMATGDSKLLLVDRIYPDRLEVTRAHQAIARSDLNMLLGPGGRERTESELRELLHATGFIVKQIIPLEQSFNIIEAIPDF
jgi:hypothetical protein